MSKGSSHHGPVKSVNVNNVLTGHYAQTHITLEFEGGNEVVLTVEHLGNPGEALDFAMLLIHHNGRKNVVHQADQHVQVNIFFPTK